MLENGIDEFELASIIDTYGRTFPLSFKTFIVNDTTVQTKYGLTLLYAGDTDIKELDELHIVTTASFSKEDSAFFGNTKLVKYDKMNKEYPIDVCLKRISEQYGNKFKNVVKLLLDYN